VKFLKRASQKLHWIKLEMEVTNQVVEIFRTCRFRDGVSIKIVNVTEQN